MLNKIKNNLLFVKVFSVLSAIVPFGSVYAAGAGIRFGSDQAITLNEIEQVVVDVVCWLTRIGFLLLIAFILITGIRMATAGSNSGRFSMATSALKNVLWGGLVILGVGVIISTLGYILGVPFIIPVICTPFGNF